MFNLALASSFAIPEGPLLKLFSNKYSLQEVAIAFFAYFVILFLCFPLHEIAHAFAAYKMGDKSVLYTGQLSLSPMAHIDPMGAIAMLIFPIGWAKPVYWHPEATKNPRKSIALVSLAGPLMNIIIAFIITIIYKIIFYSAGLSSAAAIASSEYLVYILSGINIVIYINIILAVINLIPLPPFDGFGVLSYFLKPKQLEFFARYQHIFPMIVFALLFLTPFFAPFIAVVGGMIGMVIEVCTVFVDLIFGLF